MQIIPLSCSLVFVLNFSGLTLTPLEKTPSAPKGRDNVLYFSEVTRYVVGGVSAGVGFGRPGTAYGSIDCVTLHLSPLGSPKVP